MGMITSRALQNADIAALERLLLGAPQYNVFHLSVLSEVGLGGSTWAVGVFLDGNMAGAVMASRGTGGVYYISSDEQVLDSLANVVRERSMNGRLALLSGHSSLLDPFLPMVRSSIGGRMDRCDFCVLTRPAPQAADKAQETAPSIAPISHFASSNPQWRSPRMAADADMERPIDFYLPGFYSLARLPNREAWRDRLSDQLAFRTLYLIEDTQVGWSQPPCRAPRAVVQRCSVAWPLWTNTVVWAFRRCAWARCAKSCLSKACGQWACSI